jgi:AraC-like DNA-binding protein
MQIVGKEGTVIGGWAVAIARAIDHYGHDSDDLFRRCGINLAKTRDTNARFQATRISEVLRLATKNSGDENFGLMVAKYIRPTSWHALGISIWASNSMAEGLDRFIRYRRMFHTLLQLHMETGKSESTLVLDFPRAYQPLLNDIDMDAIMATTVLTCRHFSEGNFEPLRVGLRRSETKNPQGFTRMFRCPVEFSAKENQITFSARDLTIPLPTRNAELAMLNDRLVQEYLVRLDRNDLANQVYLELMKTLGNKLPNQEQVAHALHLSQRSMQRKLQQANTSYQEILDQLRKDLASQYLRQSHLSINEIGYRLGYAKVGSFTRAFKQWMGVSPKQYRLSLLNDS